jgi:flagellar protein FlbD
MIHVTRLNHTEVVLNSDLIEQVEATPDTVISLTNGERIMVRESPEEVIARIVTFRRSILIPAEKAGSQGQTSRSLPGGPDGGE